MRGGCIRRLKYSLRIVFFNSLFDVWKSGQTGLPSSDVIKARFKGANWFSGKRAGPGQVRLSLKTDHVKGNYQKQLINVMIKVTSWALDKKDI